MSWKHSVHSRIYPRKIVMLVISVPVFAKQWTDSHGRISSQSGPNVKDCSHVQIGNLTIFHLLGSHRDADTCRTSLHTTWLKPTLNNEKNSSCHAPITLIMFNLPCRKFGPPTRPLAVNATTPSALYSKHFRKYKEGRRSIPRMKTFLHLSLSQRHTLHVALFCTLFTTLYKAVLIMLTFVLLGVLTPTWEKNQRPLWHHKVVKLRKKKKSKNVVG